MDELELTRRALAGDADPAALERVRSSLGRAIEDEGRPRPARWRAVLAVAAAVGLVVLAIALSVPAPTAAAELRRWGAIASTQGQLQPEPGEFLLLRSLEETRDGQTALDGEGRVLGSYDLITRSRVSTWVAADGSAVRRKEVLRSGFASDADRATWAAIGGPGPTPPGVDTSRSTNAIHDVRGLPTEPGALLGALRSGAVADRPPGDDQVFILIGEILAQGVAPPELRSGLFEVAARLDGIALVGEVEDPRGRSGTAVELTTANSRIRLVFDADAVQILAIEVYATVTDGGEQLSWWTAVEPTVVVGSAPTPEG